MATDNEAATAAAVDDVVSMAIAELGVKRQPEEPKDESADKETISDNADTEEEPEEKSEDSAESVEEEPATEADSAEEPEDSEDDATEEPAGEEVTKDKVQRRIDKLVAKQREAEEKAQAASAELEQLRTAKADLEAQLNQTSRPVLTPTADNPLADVDSDEALQQRIQNAQAVRRWALQNTDGTTIKQPDGSEKFIEAAEVKDYLVKADDILTIHVPARKEWLAQREPAVQAAKSMFPDIFKEGSALNQAYKATIKQAPDLLKIPQHEYWIGLALYGEQALMAKQQTEAAKDKAKKSVSAKKEKTVTPVQPVSAPRSATKGSSTAAKNRFFKSSGSMTDIEDLVGELIG
ncbi:MAG: hypothetical protein RL753_746 [Bacteroidota bacterium]